MLFFDRLKMGMETEEEISLKRHMIAENISRGTFLAYLMISLDLIFVILDMVGAAIDAYEGFHYSNYFLMYLLLIFVSIRFLLCARSMPTVAEMSPRQLNKYDDCILFYMLAVMCWGSVLTLMDQMLYGQLTVFMVNMVACSALFYIEHNRLLLVYAPAILILFAGLPFYQQSLDVMIGHYVNAVIFIIISYTVSRVMFKGFCNDHKSREMLRKSKNLLEQEIGENTMINARLSERNMQLKQLSLSDELTGMPNRRSFRNFIDLALTSYVDFDTSFSVIMIDVDHFKKYNDHYGHNEGDRVLSMVAEVLNSVVGHAKDFAARWGGEEFIYASFAADEAEIGSIAESIRHKIANLKIPHICSKPHDHVTVSLGTATVTLSRHEDISRGIELADRALYQAKANGRNCTASY